MGNCTSKKSGKISKLNLSKLPTFKKMDKEQQPGNKTGLSTKIAPTSKGQATSFGFKRSTRSASALPTPVTLTSRVAEMRQDGQSGSSVESLCHVASSSSPLVTPKTNAEMKKSPGPGAANRFGFRSATPPRATRQSPGPHGTPISRKSPNFRSKSAGPREAREAFFKDVMQPAGSANSVLNGSSANLGVDPNPGKFWLQTSLLPRPQFPVRLSDKTFKTVTNYCRRDGPGEASSSIEPSVTEDSGLGSQANTAGETDTLHGLEFSDSSPAPPTRGRPARKLDIRMVHANKFELLDQNQRPSLGGTPFVKAPRSSASTGLVQQRTEQYLQRIAGVKDSNRQRSIAAASSPGESTESEEEKLKKDASRSEKERNVLYFMNEGVGENDEFLPGEAMAEDITLSFSSDEDSTSFPKPNQPANQKRVSNITGFAIRTDAMKLSNQLKKSSPGTSGLQREDSCFGLLNSDERTALDEDTLLELSSESESSGDKDRPMEKEIQPLNTSTDSPGTPSNASLSEGRDFLIDDEIADQPQLCFSTHEDVIGNNNGSEGTNLGIDHNDAGEQHEEENRVVRRVSVGTLSPCESLMSDDLIMDFDNSDENIDRFKPSFDGDELSLILDTKHDDLVKQWASLPRARHSNRENEGMWESARPPLTPLSVRRRRHDELMVAAASQTSPTASPRLRIRSKSQTHRTNGKLGAGSSGNSSPASHRSGVSRASTDEDLSIRLDKTTYQHMFQDIVTIKSMLLKLNRVLSESDGSLGPFTEDESAGDLKKQVAFLQQQLQQRESHLQGLQMEVNRNVDQRTRGDGPIFCNAATQTDRVRPISTGPSILQSLPSDTNNVVTNGSKKVAEWIEENNRNCVVRTAPVDKIMEKVKELSLKPVEVLERERAERRNIRGKNVFKITKIDLVLKSDNYGNSELRKS